MRITVVAGSATVGASTIHIPSSGMLGWVKNNALRLAEGGIAYQDFVNTFQSNDGMITIPGIAAEKGPSVVLPHDVDIKFEQVRCDLGDAATMPTDSGAVCVEFKHPKCHQENDSNE